MKSIVTLLVALVICSKAHTQPAGADAAIPPVYPRLVIGIVVDQMKHDYIYRYWDKLGDGGFKRLVNGGHVFKNARFDYMPTFTGPGHASIYTGTTPSVHGIISNYWYDKSNGDTTYCVKDLTVESVGGSHAAGSMSPRWLLTTTLADEFKLRFNFLPKAYGISIKDRGAILPAGHSGDGAFWFDASTGHWITSTFYMNTLPEWLEKFNKKRLPEQFLSAPWTTLLPLNKYIESTADDTPYEQPFTGEARPVFPHDLSALRTPNNYDLVPRSPGGNTLTVELAKELIRAERLGEDRVPDFLSVSFSAPDYIGHQFGPHSVETEDCYLRLDRDLADFFSFLDGHLDMKNVLLFLTSDHGAVPNARLLHDHRIPSGFFDGSMYADTLEAFLESRYGTGRWIKAIDNNMVFLDHDLISSTKNDLSEIQDRLAGLARTLPLVADAVTAHTLMESEFDRAPRSLLQKGFHVKRSGDVMLLPRPGYSDYGNSPGTTHGSPYPYDTQVPLIFYGWKIDKGESMKPVAITGIAPTISLFLDMDFPNGCTGQPIRELFRQ